MWCVGACARYLPRIVLAQQRICRVACQKKVFSRVLVLATKGVLARVLAIARHRRALWLRSSASAALLARVTFSSRAVWQRVVGAPQHLALLRQGAALQHLSTFCLAEASAARQHLSTFCLAEARCVNYTQHLSTSLCSWAPSDAKGLVSALRNA